MSSQKPVHTSDSQSISIPQFMPDLLPWYNLIKTNLFFALSPHLRSSTSIHCLSTYVLIKTNFINDSGIYNSVITAELSSIPTSNYLEFYYKPGIRPVLFEHQTLFLDPLLSNNIDHTPVGFSWNYTAVN